MITAKTSDFSDLLKTGWLFIICAAFVLMNTIFIANGFLLFSLLPIAILIVLLMIFSIDRLLLIITFATPFAINIRNVDFGMGMSLPTEPLMFAIMILFFVKLLYQGKFDRKVISHPITLVILINIIWMLVTTISSTMPLVSVKFLTSHLWFICCFYFLGTQLFKNEPNIRRFIWLYAISLIAIIGYTIYRHYVFGFTEKSAHWVMSPFYNDHTAYAAIIAMFIPIFIGFVFDMKYTLFTRLMAAFISIIFLVAMVLSYTRAAWLSLAIALIIFLIMKFRVKFKYLMYVGVGLIVLYFAYYPQIERKLEKNRQDANSNFTKHLQSISNISTDASNLERFNRWKSAYRMFKLKPVLGWGPGTYMFKYAPFQHSNEMTIISTNAGDRGNAHSEYIGPLAEQGAFGMISFILIAGVVIYRAVILYNRLTDKGLRTIVIGLLLGIIFSIPIKLQFLSGDLLRL